MDAEKRCRVRARRRRSFWTGEALRLAPNLQVARRDAVQYAISARGAHPLLFGAGYRHARDRARPVLLFRLVPERRTLAWRNFFVQDQLALSPRLEATLGLKLEHNDYTGVEVLPSARLAWKASDRALLWGSASRAVRAPARFDREVFFPATPPFLVVGGPDFESEVANVIELGWRAQASPTLSWSVTAFAHFWDGLRSGTAPPVVIENRIEGTVAGVEAWSSYEPAPFWVVHAGFTYLDEDLRLEPGSTDPVGTDNPNLRNDPEYHWSLRSGFDLPADLALDLHWRGVASLPNPRVPAYSELDARLAWRPLSDVELSIVGRNLLHEDHPEFGPPAGRSRIARSLHGRIEWRF